MWYDLSSEWEIAGSVVAGSFGAQKNLHFREKHIFSQTKSEQLAPMSSFYLIRSSCNSS